MTQKKEMMMSGSNEKTCNSSEQPILVPDLIIAILERLSLVDFHRARCVSSEWYHASKSCIIREGTNGPWLILFPKEHHHHHHKHENESCKLFNPRDEKSYIVRDLGFNVAKSRCLANCGSWFLMLEHGTNILLLNLFTRERIPLPSLESIDGSDEIIFMNLCANLHYKDKDKYKPCPKSSRGLNPNGIHKAVLWVDEKSRDYLVLWSHDNFMAYHKRGDNNNNNETSWKVFEPLKYEGCVDMVFKESKFYVLRKNGVVNVFDFSGGDSPMECASFPSLNPRGYFDRDHYKFYNLVVTLSGEVLITIHMFRPYAVFKMDPKSSEWKKIKSLGDDEALILDLGRTVAAKDGVVKNCIYYCETEDKFQGCKNMFKHNCLHSIKLFIASPPIDCKDARWFFPTFGGY